MADAVQYIRESFREIWRWLIKLSLRTWLIIFLGPMFALLASWQLQLSFSGTAIIQLPIVIIVSICMYEDLRKRILPMQWPAVAIGAFVVLLVFCSIALVPKTELHDELLLTESALQKMFKAQNPYAADYRGSLVDEWVGQSTKTSYVNGVYPGWDHYVYLPGFFVVSAPFYVVVKPLFGWYDQRIVYGVTFALLLIVLWASLAHSPRRVELFTAFSLSPFLISVLYGFNDILSIFLLALTALLLVKKKVVFAAIVYGLALATKQTAWITALFFVPIFIATVKASARSVTSVFLILLASTAAIIVPFFLWSPSGFFDDTVRFFLGSTAYPISGEGIGRFLLNAGIVTGSQSFPFWVFQIAVTLPLAVVLCIALIKRPTVSRSFFAATATLACYWFFSRYFLAAHVNVIILLLMIGLIITEVEHNKGTT
ncbi:MAG: glycosyltransferase family 87 protein [Candidatus Kerfeldbacteria bacterium]